MSNVFDEAGHMAQIEAGMEAYARDHAKPKIRPGLTKAGSDWIGSPIEVKIIDDDMTQGCETGAYITIRDANGENPIEVFIGHIGHGIFIGETDIYANGLNQSFTTMIVDSEGSVAMIPHQDRDIEWGPAIERRFGMDESGENYEEEIHQLLERANG